MVAHMPFERNLPETILVWFLQILGAAAAIIFGVYGALSWQNSVAAKQQADMANMVAVVALCAQLKELSGGHQVSHGPMPPWACKVDEHGGAELTHGATEKSPSFALFCDGVQLAAEKSVSSLAEALLGPITSAQGATASPTMSGNGTTPGPTSTTTTSNPQPTVGGPKGYAGVTIDKETNLALGLGLGIGIPVLVISGLTWWGARLRARRMGMVDGYPSDR